MICIIHLLDDFTMKIRVPLDACYYITKYNLIYIKKVTHKSLFWYRWIEEIN